MCSFDLSCLCHLKVTLRILPLARKREGFFGVTLSKAAGASAAACPRMRVSTQLGCKSRAHAAWGHPQPWVTLESAHSGTGDVAGNNKDLQLKCKLFSFFFFSIPQIILLI